MKKKLSKREITLIVGFGIVAVILLGFQFLIKPELDRKSELSAEKVLLSQAYDLAVNAGGVADRVVKEYERNSAFLEGLIGSKIGRNMTDEELDSFVTMLVLDSGMKPKSLVIEKAAGDGYDHLEKVYVTIDASGSLDGFARLLLEVQSRDYLTLLNYEAATGMSDGSYSLKLQVLMLAGD